MNLLAFLLDFSGLFVPVLGTLGLSAVTWGLIAAGVGAAGTVGGAAISAKGTRDAQNAANAQNDQAAGMQNQQAFQNYLSSRGVNIQQLLQKYPEFLTEYNRVRASGDRRDFNTWIFEALRAQPGHPIWNDINAPAVGAGAANTTLPAWAKDAAGNPLQPSILQQLVGIQSGTNLAAKAPIGSIASVQNINALLTARPEIRTEIEDARLGSDDPRSTEQWLVDHITQTEGASGGGTFSTALRQHLTEQEAADPNKAPSIDPRIMDLVPGALDTAGGIFDGTLLKELQGGLDPVAAARLQQAELQQKRLDELRGLSGTLRDTELGGLTNVLEARKTGAAGIHGAATTAAQGEHDANVEKLATLLNVRKEAAEQIYNATTTGAKDIYGAESLRADTYGQSAEQALNRMLATQGANRARQGYGGGSSGSDLTRARLTADYVQRGAGARADAGVNLQGRLAGAGVGRATTVGASNEADAQARLQAAVQLARQLGVAGVGQAGTLASAGESDAIGRLNAQVEDARRRMGYLTSDADIAVAKAQEQNALDQLNALIADQNRRTGSIGLPYSLAGQDLGLKTSLYEAPYLSIDSLMKRLGPFYTNPAGGPSVVTPNVQPVINNQQIIGGALSGLGSAIGTYQNNQAIQQAINQYGGTAPRATAPAAGDYIPPDTSGQFRFGGSVFRTVPPG